MSVAMATFNGVDYLSKQLRSLATQTCLPDELVVRDDGSTDGTRSILQSFAESAPFRVKILLNETRLGYTGNFNVALEESSGELVFLCDQDDVWFPRKIEIMRNLSEMNPQALLYMNDASL